MITPIRRALLSVSDKTDLVEFARRLANAGVELLSTGGTARQLTEQGIAVTEVSDYTGFPEMMDGRLKTLHPRIHGGLLGRRGLDDAAMATHNILPIDLVVVNLYPFEHTIANPQCQLEQAIEQIDIGGPTMLRAAAKNYAAVTVVVDPADYDRVATALETEGGVRDADRFSLAVKVFEHTARYDGAIANWLGKQLSEEEGGGDFPRTINLQFVKTQGMRYGENPHQRAAFYREHRKPAHWKELTIANARQVQGKELSFNNVADTDAALACVRAFAEPACVIVKHANPCGAAVSHDMLTAYYRAYEADPTSAFGGVIALNRTLDRATATAILNNQFVEVIVASNVAEDALPVLATKKNVRVLVMDHFFYEEDSDPVLDLKRVAGGLLVQDRDLGSIGVRDLKLVTKREPTPMERRDLLFAWTVVKYVKSNAILLARDRVTVGIGAGQMSRVDSSRIAVLKAAEAGIETQGAVLASDAFFPFRDGLDQAATAGVTAVIQPGGSLRDEEVIAAANEHDIAMVFTGMRHFRH